MTQEFSKVVTEENLPELLLKISTKRDDFDKPFISDNSIINSLNKKIEAENEIETQLKKKGFSHFSSKKFIGDLGEYYAQINLKHLFEEGTLKISGKSNSSYDIEGKLRSEVASEWNINQVVKIEVKTRFHQKGNPHLFGIKEGNFDLLVYVSLNENYTVHFIGVSRKIDLPKVDLQKRIVFNKDLKLVYPTNIKFETHK